LSAVLKVKKMPWSPKFAPKFVPRYAGPTVVERLIAGLCYVTFGMVGLIYLIVTGKKNQSNYLQFNFLQSILLGLLGIVLSYSISAIANLLGGTVGLINSGAANVITSPFALLGAGIKALSFILMLYGAIWAFLGKEAEIPFISKLVRRQMR
jgi:uncharacterized membrane protein